MKNIMLFGKHDVTHLLKSVVSIKLPLKTYKFVEIIVQPHVTIKKSKCMNLI